MMITKYIIKEDFSTSMGNLVKVATAVIIISILFETTLYLAFDSGIKNSIYSSQSNEPEIEDDFANKKLVANDGRAIMSVVGYIEFERSYLIEHVLYPLNLNRRILACNSKFISRQSSQNSLQNNLSLIANCAEFNFRFETISGQITNTMSKHSLQTLDVTIPPDVVNMNWTCQVKNFDKNFPINASYNSDKRASYPCFRGVNLPKGSKGIAANIHIIEMTISLNDG